MVGRREHNAPVAVVGMACRVPGAGDLGTLWRNLCEGRDSVTRAPADREVDGPGGFLDRVDTFDAGFFGVSPREAALTDPQQRLMLELAWEAVEDARIVPDRLRDSRTGVFAGAIADDYAALLHRAGAAAVTSHTLTGTHRSLIANRVSHTLGLTGPSLTVDSGQCSSLVAVHLACQSLWCGESELAIAAGVNLIVSADAAAAVAGSGALSPDGRCYTFDARANGYVRGEGGAAVVLKPLARAVVDGDRIHCVILGSAVNHDGAGEAITVPNRRAQESVLTAACQRAGVWPGDIQYVELHGTGTVAGDPVEAAALGSVLGAGRPAESPLLVGSVKTNVGHLEGAAGITGLVKTALSIGHRQLPPSLNFERPNPRIPLAELGLCVQRDLGSWPRPDRRLLAGVSSFGMGGTNCHVVLADPVAADFTSATPARPDPGPTVWSLSGRSRDAVRDQALRLLDRVESDPGLHPGDVGFSLATTRLVFDRRAVVVGANRSGLLAGLRAVAAERPATGVFTGTGAQRRVALVFPGQGAQRPQMGRRLYGRFPVFAGAFDDVCARLDPRLPHPLREAVWERPELLEETLYAQAALFAVEVATYRLLERCGVRPAYVAGHSLGEITAAHVAGVMSLDDACALVAARGRLMGELPPGGAMAWLNAGENEVRDRMGAAGSGVAVAAVNGPASVVISGPRTDVDRIRDRFSRAGHRTRWLRVGHGFHSPLVEPMLHDLETVVRGLHLLPPTGVALASAVTGALVDPAEVCSPRFWVSQVRQTVRFADTVAALRAAGADLFWEVGHGGALTAAARSVLREADPPATVIAGLAEPDREDEALLRSLAQLHVRGAPIDWRPVLGAGRRTVDLPTYPFQRTRHWIDAVPVPPALDRAPVPAGDTRPPAAMEAGPVDVRVLVRDRIAVVMGLSDGGAVDVSLSFSDLGFNSAMGVELEVALAEATGLPLSPTMIFDHPTPAVLVDHLRERLGQADGAAAPTGPAVADADPTEPVAIIGMGCRYPGEVGSPEDLWRLVSEGRDAIAPFPVDRGWDLARLHGDGNGSGNCSSTTRFGGFLDDVAGFDAEFFGISPREAAGMDPQQRQLLEVAWETLERAGVNPNGSDPTGRDVGVFVGATAQEYGPGLEGGDGYALTGTSPSVASGRLAYTWDLRGPALTVDTACSSSLVAVHLAVGSLRSGQCRLALAGGVAAMVSPGMFVEFSRQGGLAPDGRCKAFAAAADGTAWAEGVGLLLLERLSDARANGHPVLGVIRGSAVNQDGASNGLTAPSGRAQEDVIRRALADARLEPAAVDAVEAHGTGTTLGDPIEARALFAVYGRERPADRPLRLGSLKSNIGHAQAAAGVGGVIKMVQAMRHGLLPVTLHVDAPTPHVDWSSGAVSLLTEPAGWPTDGRPRRCAVSSFGISGTNAHVVLESAADGGAPAPASSVSETVSVAETVPWVVSARSRDGLREQARRLADTTGTHRPVDVGYTLATGRALFAHRAVVLGERPDDIAARLAALSRGADAPGLVTGEAVPGKVAFVFPGQGSQWPGMARDLLDTAPPFAAAVRRCEAALAPHVDWSLVHVLRGAPDAPGLDSVAVVQPVLFAVMVSLAELWRSMGVYPDAVAGHSQGEIAAACVCGALSLEDAATVVALRSRAILALAGTGGMAAVSLPADGARARMRPWAGRLHVAAFNGPSMTIVAGDRHSLDEFVTACDRDGVYARRIDVDYASHTPHVERVREHLLDALRNITPRRTETPLYSALTGGRIEPEELDADYWYRTLRHPVRFLDVTRALVAADHRLFVEASPHPVLGIAITETLEADGSPGTALATLKRGEGTWNRMLTAVAEAQVRGATVDWGPFFAERQARRVDVPTYAFRHQRYWSVTRTPTADGHPLAGAAVRLPDTGGVVLSGQVTPPAQPWLGGHVVAGRALLPGAAFVETAVRAGVHIGHGMVDRLTVTTPLELPEDGSTHLRTVVGAADADGRRPVTIHSAPDPDAGPWTRHADGLLSASRDTPAPERDESWPPLGARDLDVDDLYDVLADRGHAYGPEYRCVRSAWRRGDELFAEVALPPGRRAEADVFGVHPALLDAAVHVWLRFADVPSGAVPVAWERVRLHATGAAALRVRLAPRPSGRPALTAVDPAGAPVLTADSVTFGAVDGGGSVGPLHRVRWVPLAPATEPRPVRYAVLDSDGPWPPAVDEASVPDVAFVEAPVEAGDAGPETARAAARCVLALVQGWLSAGHLARCRLVVATRGATIGDTPAAAPVWGLIRCAHSEHAGRFAVVDLDRALTAVPAETLSSVADAVVAGEQQLAVVGDRVRVARLVRADDTGLLGQPVESGAWRLTTRRPGLLEDLELTADPDAAAPLGHGQVRIAVRAAGLNFHDVLAALGAIPDDDGLGFEGAGVVTEAGPGVTDLPPGTRVFGLFDHAFGSVAVADRRRLLPIPRGWTFAEAAAVPVTYLTAYLALVRVARVRAGETLLVHAAAGGVGMAAVQLGRHLGAEVYGTAAPAKWDALRARGLDDLHLASSRSSGFETAFRTATGGRGVDVVLNCLAGDLTDASLRLLASGGRLIDLGRTDLRDPHAVAADHPETIYRAINLRDVPTPEIAEMFVEIVELLDRADLQPPPVTSWDLRRAPEAFRVMSKGGHTGKIVLTVPSAPDPRGTALITGGTGTLAAVIARHLVTRYGVRHLVLAGRRGPDAPGMAELCAELGTHGAEVVVSACDVTDRRALERLVDEIPATRPLTAVVHAAAVLDEALVSRLSPESLDRVLRPKVDAAWLLHDLTRCHDLAAFVLFSSAASLLGQAGQGNYAAANAYLDALAAHRRARGLPAHSVAWGIWAGHSGMTARLSRIHLERFRRFGMAALPADEALAMFDAALAADDAVPVAMRLDGGALRTGNGQIPPLLRHLVTESRPREAEPRQAGRAGRTTDLVQLICAETARILGYSDPGAVTGQRSFKELGADSLAALELRNRIAAATGLHIAASAVLACATPAALAARLREEPGSPENEEA